MKRRLNTEEKLRIIFTILPIIVSTAAIIISFTDTNA